MSANHGMAWAWQTCTRNVDSLIDVSTLDENAIVLLSWHCRGSRWILEVSYPKMGVSDPVTANITMTTNIGHTSTKQ